MKILYFDVDSLSPNHMSCYGYARNTTPNIDKISKNSLIFTNMYTSDAPCLPSRTALITGQFGIHTGVVNHGGKYADLRPLNEGRNFTHPLNEDGLFSLINRAGLRTVLISPFADRHSAFWFNAGFNEIYNYGDSGTMLADEVVGHADKWLENNKEKDDWFLYVNMWDPHTPYRTPKEYGNPFENDDEIWIDENILTLHKKRVGPHTTSNLDMYEDEHHENPDFIRAIGKINNLEDVKTFIDGYDCGIHYADYNIGLIIDKLKEQGIYDETIIVVSADHGECMGDLGIYGEHGTADNTTCNIPFIVKPSGSKFEGEKYNGMHYNLDILPTVAEYLDTSPINPETVWHGKSFLGAFNGKTPSRDYLILSQMAHVCQRSVRFDEYIYIRTYHNGYHLDFKKDMLFNLKDDPHEQKDISSEKYNLVLQANKILSDWYHERMSNLPSYYVDDPMYTILKEGGPHHANDGIYIFADTLKKQNRLEELEILKEENPLWYRDK